jgi:predicted double-glycine peptidase
MRQIMGEQEMKIIPFPEARQTFNFDCGADALQSVLVAYGIEEREDRLIKLARTTARAGTSMDWVTYVLGYYGLAYHARQGLTPDNLCDCINLDRPTIIAIQAYRSSALPYNKLRNDGHYVVAIGCDNHRIIFEDPSSFCRTWLADEELRQRWHDVDQGKLIRGWGCTILKPCTFEPGKLEHME